MEPLMEILIKSLSEESLELLLNAENTVKYFTRSILLDLLKRKDIKNETKAAAIRKYDPSRLPDANHEMGIDEYIIEEK